MPGRNLWLTFADLDLDHPNFTPLQGPIAGKNSPMFSSPAQRKAMAKGPLLLWANDRWLLTRDEPAGGRKQLATAPNFIANNCKIKPDQTSSRHANIADEN